MGAVIGIENAEALSRKKFHHRLMIEGPTRQKKQVKSGDEWTLLIIKYILPVIFEVERHVSGREA